MKNKVFTVALLLLMSQILFSQNYLNNGGFEEGKSDINMTSYPTTYTHINRISVPSCVLIGDDHHYRSESINSDWPGGFGGIHYKCHYWTDRGIYNIGGDCNSDCYPHLAHWGYVDENWPIPPDYVPSSAYLGYDSYWVHDRWERGDAAIIAQSGRGCAISQPYCMFQQNMAIAMNRSGLYYVSGYIKKSDSHSGTNIPDYTVNMILSNAQPTYEHESCEDFNDLGDIPYGTITGVDFGSGYGPDHKVDIPFSMSDANFTDWQYVEKEIYVSGREDLRWFSVNVAQTYGGGRDNDAHAAYFGFDNFYVSDVGCACPVVRLLQNQAISSPTLIRAQQYIRAGNNVGNITTGNGPVEVLQGSSGKTIFRAGSYISLESGFSVSNGAVFETQIRSCYDAESPIKVLSLPDAYSPNCDGVNDYFCFFVENATSFTFHVYNSWFQEIADLSGSIPAETNKVCLDIPLDVPGSDYAYIYFLDLYGCQGQKLDTIGEFVAFDAVEGCYAAKTNPLVRNIAQSSSNFTNMHAKPVMNIYPDPACQDVTVQSSELTNDGEVFISDMNGNIITKMPYNGTKTTYDISYLANGVYLVSYKNDKGTFTQKITKICQ